MSSWCRRTVVIRWEFMSSCTNWASTCLAEGGSSSRYRSCVKMHASPQPTVLTILYSLVLPHNQIWLLEHTMTHFVNVRSALWCHDCICFVACLSSIANHAFQEQFWIKQYWSENALSRILPQTSWDWVQDDTEHFCCFSSSCGQWVLQCSSLCCCVHRLILRNSCYSSWCCMYIANAASSSSAYLATAGHDWRISSGFTPTWRKYWRLPIRTRRNFLWRFLPSLSRADHIDQSWKLQTDKRWMSAVFSTVFCDYTLMISWIFFCYCTFFVMAADRLLIICL